MDRWPGNRSGVRLELLLRPGPGFELALDGLVTSTDAGNESGLNLRFRMYDLISTLSR